jgi:hypothetical protein
LFDCGGDLLGISFAIIVDHLEELYKMSYMANNILTKFAGYFQILLIVDWEGLLFTVALAEAYSGTLLNH